MDLINVTSEVDNGSASIVRTEVITNTVLIVNTRKKGGGLDYRGDTIDNYIGNDNDSDNYNTKGISFLP